VADSTRIDGDDPVCVTGIGLFTGLARGAEREALDLRERILAGGLSAAAGGGGDVPLGDCDFSAYLGGRGLRHMTRGTLALLAASRLALEDAGIAAGSTGAGLEIGVTAGTATASAGLVADFDRTTLREGPLAVNPALFPQTVWNGASSQVAIRFGLRGPNLTLSTGLNSGLDALLAAARLLRCGRARAVLAGGFEEITPFFRVLFGREGAGEPPRLGEGAAVLLLERASSAKARGARLIAAIQPGRSAYAGSPRAGADRLAALVDEVLAAGASPARTWRMALHASHAEPRADARVIDLFAFAGCCGGLSGVLAGALAAAGAHAPELLVADDGRGRFGALLVSPAA